MNKKPYHDLSGMMPLFFIIFIDSMGLGLVYPILNSLYIDPTTSIVSHASLAQRQLYYGITISIFMFCWFFGSTILGDLSDSIGRKRALMICLLGSFVGYLLSAIAVDLKLPLLIILGRVIAGFTAGSQPIAQAAIIDVSQKDNKTQNIGFILAASSLGFILGPLIGGIFSDKSISHYFNFSTPFAIVAVLSLLNALLLKIFMHETLHTHKTISIKFHRAFQLFISAYKRQDIRLLSIVYLLMIGGWNAYYSYTPNFLLMKFNFSSLKIALFNAVMGAGFGIGSGYLAGRICLRFSPKNTIIISYIIAAATNLCLVLSPSSMPLWWLVFINSAALAIGYSAIITIFSNTVADHEQGWVMGVTGSIMALSATIIIFLFAFIIKSHPAMPLYFSVISIALSAVCLIPLKLNEQNKAQ